MKEIYVNFLQFFFQNPIDKTVPLQQRFALKLCRNDHAFKFPATAIGHVFDLTMNCLEFFLKLFLNEVCRISTHALKKQK